MVVVSSKSAVTTLDKVQVNDIFQRKVTRHADGSPIVSIDLAEQQTERDEFYSRVSGKSPAQLRAYWSKIVFTGRGQPPRSVTTAAEMNAKAVDGSLRIVY